MRACKPSKSRIFSESMNSSELFGSTAARGATDSAGRGLKLLEKTVRSSPPALPQHNRSNKTAGARTWRVRVSTMTNSKFAAGRKSGAMCLFVVRNALPFLYPKEGFVAFASARVNKL